MRDKGRWKDAGPEVRHSVDDDTLNGRMHAVEMEHIVANWEPLRTPYPS